MYPYFTLRGHTLYAVGIGIVISAFVFLTVAWYHAKKLKVQFSKLFFWIPTLLIACYLLGNWAGMGFEDGVWFPLRSFRTLRAWLSPYGYNFHFVGLMLGAAFAWRRFFKKIFMKTEREKWIEVFFYAFAASLIPMGLFLLLGDTFIGKPTDAWFGVVALLNDSAWTNYGRVLPIGIMVSIVGFISYGIILMCNKLLSYQKIWGYLGFSMIFFGLAIIFLGQYYPRHGVVSFLGYTWDIKNYIALLISLYFFVQFMRTQKRK